MMPRSTTPSGPFIVPTSEEAAQIAHFAHELDAMASQCGTLSSCDQWQFARALVMLFESREAAQDAFRVISATPSSPLATSSTLWLQLLGNDELQWTTEPQRKAFSQLVRDWVDRRLTEYHQEGKRNDSPRLDVIADQLRVVQALHKQVRERDRYIAELRSQLDALKVIDHDTEDRKRKIRPPVSFVPTVEHTR